MGSGLPPAAYGLLLAASIALFLFWDGPLWTRPHDASHVMRFAVSYLAVPPLAALALRALRRFTWTRLLTGLGTIWGIKLVATSVLYLALARGTAVSVEPVHARAAPPREPAAPLFYRSAPGRFAAGTIRARVDAAGDGAAIYLIGPAPGLPPPPERTQLLAIAGGRFDRALYLATTADRLQAANRDGRLHTIHLHRGSEALANQPVPPDGQLHDLAAPEPGEYHVGSDADPATAAWLLVVDHPYAVAGGGELRLDGVPAGPARLVAVAVHDGRLWRVERLVDVAAGGVVDVELSPAPADVVASRSQP